MNDYERLDAAVDEAWAEIARLYLASVRERVFGGVPAETLGPPWRSEKRLRTSGCQLTLDDSSRSA